MGKAHIDGIVLDKINHMARFCPVLQIFQRFRFALVIMTVCFPEALNEWDDLCFFVRVLL